MRSAVLCTDMAQHNQLAQQLQASCERHPFCGAPTGGSAGAAAPGSRPCPEPSRATAATASVSAPSAQRQDSSAQPSAASPAQAAGASVTPPSAADACATGATSHYSQEDRALLLRALLHLADLSNPARPLPTGATWGCLVAKEFLAQVRLLLSFSKCTAAYQVDCSRFCPCFDSHLHSADGCRSPGSYIVAVLLVASRVLLPRCRVIASGGWVCP